MFRLIKKNLFIFVIIFASLLTLYVFLARFFNTISIFELIHVLSSGYEEESLLEIWYKINNKELYVNHLIFPYRWTVYNWFFYEFYSSAYLLVNKIFEVNFLWFPNLLRILTLIGTFISAYIFYMIGKILYSSSKLNFFLLIYIFFGLTFGFWNFTVRPDIFALFFELLAIYTFVKKHNSHKVSYILLTAILLYISWSFKQTSLVTFATINIFLIFQKSYKKIFFFNTLFLLLIITTIILHDELYFKYLYFLGVSYPFDINIYLDNWIKIIAKNIFIFSSFLILLIFYFKNLKKLTLYAITEKKIDIFLILGSVLSLIYLMVVLTNAGASQNHAFIFLIYSGLLIIKYEEKILSSKLNKNILIISIFMYCIFCFIIIFEKIGRLSAKKYLDIEKYKICTNKLNLADPIFVDYNYYRLPWITSYKNPSVETYNYKFELNNKKLEYGGHEGLIEKGFYKSLIIVKPIQYNLDKYIMISECGIAKIYYLKKSLSD